MLYLCVQRVQLLVLLRVKFRNVRPSQRLGYDRLFHHIQLVLLRCRVVARVLEAQICFHFETLAQHLKVAQNIELAVLLLVVR